MLMARCIDIITLLIYRLRAILYSIKYNVGKGCFFGKIRLWDCKRNGVIFGNKVMIYRGTEIHGKSDMPVIIGDKTFINQQCIIRANVKIGENVAIGQRVNIISDSHEIGAPDRRAGKTYYPAIEIGNGCWIGTNATILGNVKIGEGTIIAAGAVVTKDCLPNSLYAGVPARKIKDLSIENEQIKIVN